MRCEYCRKNAIYRCSTCGKLVCERHAKLRTICPSCMKQEVFRYKIGKLSKDSEKKGIATLVQRFWGEEEQLTFDRKLKVANLPAYVAKMKNKIAGFVSFVDSDDSIIVAALGILPKYQNSGIGRKLLAKVEVEAKRMRKKRLLVSTSNDDLPALAFYQALGFQICEVKPNVIAEKHGKIVEGIAGLPVRDELRLQKVLG